MLADRIREARKAQPFRPFDLVLADGNTYTITHPDFLAIPPVPIPFDIVFWTELGHGDFQTHWVNLNLVQELVVPTGSVSRPAARTEGNGA